MRTRTLTVALVSVLLIGSAGTVGALAATGTLQPQQSPTGTTTPGTGVGTTTSGTGVGTTTSGTGVGTTTSGTGVGTTTSGTGVGTTTQTGGNGPGVTFNNQQSTGETVFIKSATLPKKGYVVIYNPTLSGDKANKIIGVSYLLSAGTTNNIRIQLDNPLNETTSLTAVVHTDSNNNEKFDYISSNGKQDPPLKQGGGRVLDIAKITVQSTTGGTNQADTGGTTTASGDGDTGDSDAQTTAGDSGNDSASGGSNEGNNSNDGGGSSGMFGPGFGLVVAVVALLGIALLAVRRN